MNHSLRTINSTDFHALAAMADGVAHIKPHKIRLLGLAQLAEMNYLGKVFYNTALDWLPVAVPSHGDIYRLTWNEEFKCSLPEVGDDFWLGSYACFKNNSDGTPGLFKWERIKKLADCDYLDNSERSALAGLFSEFLEPAVTVYKSRRFAGMLDTLEKDLALHIQLGEVNSQRRNAGQPEFESVEDWEVDEAQKRLDADDDFQARKSGSMGGDLPEDYEVK